MAGFWGSGFDVVGAANPMNLGSFLGPGAVPMTSANMMKAGVSPAAALMASALAGGAHPLANANPQGVSASNEEMDFLPFDEVLHDSIFDSTHTELRFESFPQRPFRGERVVISAFSATVATPEGNVVIDPAMYVGAVQIGATQGRAGISAYAPTAFGVRLTWPASGQGTRVFVPLSTIVTLTSPDTIAVTVQCIGRAVR